MQAHNAHGDLEKSIHSAGVTSEVIKLVAAKQSLKKFKANDEGHYLIISLSLLA
jgi:hypothetical protein